MKTVTAALALAALSNAAVLDKANYHKRAPVFTVIAGETLSYSAGLAVAGSNTYSWPHGVGPKPRATPAAGWYVLLHTTQHSLHHADYLQLLQHRRFQQWRS